MEVDAKMKERAEHRKKFGNVTKPIPQESFDPDYYRQPVMTEPYGEPLFYRMDTQDAMTRKVRERLRERNRSYDIGNGELEQDNEENETFHDIV